MVQAAVDDEEGAVDEAGGGEGEAERGVRDFFGIAVALEGDAAAGELLLGFVGDAARSCRCGWGRGRRQLTLTPRGPSSTAIDRVRPMTPCLAAV